MARTYLREADFRAIIPKGGGPDVVGLSIGRFKGRDLLCMRVWRATGTPGEYHSMSNGLNLSFPEFANAYHYIQLALDSRFGDEPEQPVGFPLSHGRVFQVQRQIWQRREVLSARAWMKHKEGNLTPTRNGLTLLPSLFSALLPQVARVLAEELQEWPDIVAEFQNAALLAVQRQYSPIL